MTQQGVASRVSPSTVLAAQATLVRLAMAPAVGRIVRAGDFQTVLGTTARARSEHFALHHLARLPSRSPCGVRAGSDLSTPVPVPDSAPVDDSAAVIPRLGLVVPKRHARRAVTRTLVKRQIRAAMARHGAAATGWWVVRLRQPFAVTRFPSAASTALRRAVAAELDGLFVTALRTLGLAA